MSPAALDELKREWFARPRTPDANERWLDGITDEEFQETGQRWFNGEDE